MTCARCGLPLRNGKKCKRAGCRGSQKRYHAECLTAHMKKHNITGAEEDVDAEISTEVFSQFGAIRGLDAPSPRSQPAKRGSR
jgi:hypothetical protein